MSRLESLSDDERHEFCRQVLENLSDIVDGEAPEALCREVDDLLGDCRPYIAFRGDPRGDHSRHPRTGGGGAGRGRGRSASNTVSTRSGGR